MSKSFHIHKFGLDGVELSTSLAPQFVETINRRGWVNYGEDNLYPDYLISLMNRSAKHNAILKRKTQMIAGNGWSKDGLDQTAINFIANPYGEENLDDIVRLTTLDYELFGGFSLEIIWSKDRTKIAQINYLPVNKVRISENRKHIFYSDDWTKINKFAPIKKPVFDPNMTDSSQILYVREYKPGNEYYPTPDYLPIVPYCELEYEICLFHLNQVKHGFAPSMAITFKNGIPSDDEMKDIIAQLQNDFRGAMNAGKVMFLFADGADRTPEITPINLNNSDERFVELNKEITQGILTGHQVTNPGLFGISTPGELGQKTIILESLEIFQSTYVEPRQRLIERVFNRLLRINGSSSSLKLVKYNLDLEKITNTQ